MGFTAWHDLYLYHTLKIFNNCTLDWQQFALVWAIQDQELFLLMQNHSNLTKRMDELYPKWFAKNSGRL